LDTMRDPGQKGLSERRISAACARPMNGVHGS
jgi:hypothetical protein